MRIILLIIIVSLASCRTVKVNKSYMAKDSISSVQKTSNKDSTGISNLNYTKKTVTEETSTIPFNIEGSTLSGTINPNDTGCQTIESGGLRVDYSRDPVTGKGKLTATSRDRTVNVPIDRKTTTEEHVNATSAATVNQQQEESSEIHTESQVKTKDRDVKVGGIPWYVWALLFVGVIVAGYFMIKKLLANAANKAIDEFI